MVYEPEDCINLSLCNFRMILMTIYVYFIISDILIN